MLPAMVRPRHLRTAVSSDGSLPQALSPGSQALGGPDVVEEFRGREGVQIRLRQPACQFRAGRLRRQRDALLLPLDVLGRFPGHELPEKVVDDAGAHGLHESRGCRRTVGAAAGPVRSLPRRKG